MTWSNFGKGDVGIFRPERLLVVDEMLLRLLLVPVVFVLVAAGVGGDRGAAELIGIKGSKVVNMSLL